MYRMLKHPYLYAILVERNIIILPNVLLLIKKKKYPIQGIYCLNRTRILNVFVFEFSGLLNFDFCSVFLIGNFRLVFSLN